MVEAQIKTALKGNTAAGDNVFALILPHDGLRPAITYQVITEAPINSFQGSSGLDRVRLQIDSWAKTYDAALQLEDQIRPLMEAAGFKGLRETRRSEFEEDTKLYRVSADYWVWQET
jgi:hypothetical protein